MSRFDGDGDEEFPGQWWLWEGNLHRCFNGRAGQQRLREIREALLAMPRKRLIHGRLADEKGDVCAVGAIETHRRVQAGEDRRVVTEELAKLVTEDTLYWDSWETEQNTLAVAARSKIKTPMATELAFQNDVRGTETPEECYARVLGWVEKMIVPPSG